MIDFSDRISNLMATRFKALVTECLWACGSTTEDRDNTFKAINQIIFNGTVTVEELIRVIDSCPCICNYLCKVLECKPSELIRYCRTGNYSAIKFMATLFGAEKIIMLDSKLIHNSIKRTLDKRANDERSN